MDYGFQKKSTNKCKSTLKTSQLAMIRDSGYGVCDDDPIKSDLKKVHQVL